MNPLFRRRPFLPLVLLIEAPIRPVWARLLMIGAFPSAQILSVSSLSLLKVLLKPRMSSLSLLQKSLETVRLKTRFKFASTDIRLQRAL